MLKVPGRKTITEFLRKPETPADVMRKFGIVSSAMNPTLSFLNKGLKDKTGKGIGQWSTDTLVAPAIGVLQAIENNLNERSNRQLAKLGAERNIIQRAPINDSVKFFQDVAEGLDYRMGFTNMTPITGNVKGPIEQFSDSIPTNTTIKSLVAKGAMTKEEYESATADNPEEYQVDDGSETLRLLTGIISGPKGEGGVSLGLIPREAAATVLAPLAMSLDVNPIPKPDDIGKIAKVKPAQVYENVAKLVPEIRTELYRVQDEISQFTNVEDFIKSQPTLIRSGDETFTLSPWADRYVSSTRREADDLYQMSKDNIPEDVIKRAQERGADVVIHNDYVLPLKKDAVLYLGDDVKKVFNTYNTQNIKAPKPVARKLLDLEARKTAQPALNRAARVAKSDAYKAGKLAQDTKLQNRTNYLNKLQDKAIEYVDALVTDPVQKLKLMRKAVAITTENQLQKKILDPAQNFANKQYRNDLTDSIRAMQEEADELIMKSKVTPAAYKRITTFLADYQSNKLSAKKRKSLERLQNTLEESPELRQQIPQNRLNELTRLSRKPFSQLSTGELELIQSTLSGMLSRATVESKILDMADKLKAQTLAKEIAPTVRNVDNLTIGEKFDPVTGTVKKNNFLLRSLKTLKRGDFETMPVDYLFEALGGGFMNNLWKSVRLPTLEGVNSARIHHDRLMTVLNDIELEHGLDPQDFYTIGKYAISKQKGGKKVLSKMGVDVPESLTEGQKAYYDASRKMFDDTYADIAAVYERSEKQPLGFIENFTPWMRLNDATLPMDTQDEILSAFSNQRRISFGSVKQRDITVENPLILDYRATTERYLNNATYYTHVQPAVNDARNLMKEKTLRDSLGNMGSGYVDRYIDVIAKRGRRSGSDSVLTKGVKEARIVITAATFFLRATTAAKQFLANFNTAGEIGTTPVIKASIDLANSPKKLSKFALEASPQLRRRLGDDPFYEEIDNAILQAGLENSNRAKFKKANAAIERAGMSLTKLSDNLTATSGWIAAYRTKLDDLGLEFKTDEVVDEAREYADYIVNTTQGSSSFSDLPLAFTSGTRGGTELTRALFTFQTFALTDWHYMRGAVGNAISKDPMKGMRQLILLGGAIALEDGIDNAMSQIMYPQFQEDKTSLVNSLVMGTIQRVPLLGSVARSFMFYREPEESVRETLARMSDNPEEALVDVGMRTNPIISTMTNLMANLGTAIFAEEEDDRKKAQWKLLFESPKYNKSLAFLAPVMRWMKSDYYKSLYGEFKPNVFFRERFNRRESKRREIRAKINEVRQRTQTSTPSMMLR